MKLIPVTYYGFTAMDRRFSSPMLPWIVSEIRKRDYSEKLSLGIEDGILQAYNPDFELQFSHKIWQVTRFSQADQDPTTFLYLMRDDNDTLLYCYLFQAKKSADVLHVIDQVLDPMLLTPFINPTTFDFLENYQNWKLGYRKVSNFFKRVLFHGKESLFKKSGGHTFFIPIDDKKHDHRLADIDSYIIEAHVVPNMVLFTRPTTKNFTFETASNGDYVYIVVALEVQSGKDFVRSHTVLGDNEHRRGVILAEIVKGNIPVTNGVIHLISQPLAVFHKNLPPFPYLPVSYKIAADPELNITYYAGQKGRINNVLRRQSDSYYTYFAPRNRAWSNYLGYTKGEMGHILNRHLVVSDSRFTMSKLVTSSKGSTILETLDGPVRVTMVFVNGSYYIKWGQKEIRVVRPDYECSDGVVHIVDDVFAAPNFPAGVSQPPKTSFWRSLKNLVN